MLLGWASNHTIAIRGEHTSLHSLKGKPFPLNGDSTHLLSLQTYSVGELLHSALHSFSGKPFCPASATTQLLSTHT